MVIKTAAFDLLGRMLDLIGQFPRSTPTKPAWTHGFGPRWTPPLRTWPR
ncbi:hypothetical protein ACFQZ4_45865 [Catellatospora coxensis]